MLRTFFTSASLLTLPFLARAQTQIRDAAEGFENLDTNRVVSILLGIAQWLLIIAGIIAVIMTLWSSFLFLTAVSDDKRSSAKKTLLWAIVGVAVAILSYAIVSFTGSILEP